MSNLDQASHDARWAEIKRKQAESVGVPIKGFDRLVKVSTGEDTFQWAAGPDITDFYARHGITVLSSRNSDEPDITTFFFPKHCEDIAALFKLTFA
jgi:hypothetical protein